MYSNTVNASCEIAYLSKPQLHSYLCEYILSWEERVQYGYPVESYLNPGCVTINYQEHPMSKKKREQQQRINLLMDSTNSHSIANAAFVTDERCCERCSRSFYVNGNNGDYLYPEECTYHPGRLLGRYNAPPGAGDYWDCCSGHESTSGCTVAKSHVWKGHCPSPGEHIEGFIKLKAAKTLASCYGIYGMDCEMCFTKKGLELCKVTVVDVDGNIVYDSLVKPKDEIVDYNTKFSGLREEDFVVTTKNLEDVQRELSHLIFADSILIGHGLENDLRALKIVHSKIIDTSLLFPHHLGLPYRNGLKSLAKKCLRRDMQIDEHNAYEDAKTAMDLVLLKLRSDVQEEYNSCMNNYNSAWHNSLSIYVCCM